MYKYTSIRTQRHLMIILCFFKDNKPLSLYSKCSSVDACSAGGTRYTQGSNRRKTKTQWGAFNRSFTDSAISRDFRVPGWAYAGLSDHKEFQVDLVLLVLTNWWPWQICAFFDYCHNSDKKMKRRAPANLLSVSFHSLLFLHLPLLWFSIDIHFLFNHAIIPV